MYKVQWFGTDDADFAKAIELFDATTNQPLDTTDADFNLQVSECGTSMLAASTEDATIVVPETGVVQFTFTAEQMGGLEPGTTYDVGLTMTTNTGKTQLLYGTLAIINGGF
jgi:hypothetical protein